MKRVCKIAVCLVGVLALAAALFWVMQKAEQNRPYQTRKELREAVEDAAPKAEDARLQMALDDPEAFQGALLGEEPSREREAVVAAPQPGSADEAGALGEETPGPEPLSAEASSARKERMGQALREFTFLRSPQYRDPDSELNRQTLDKLAEMRRQRLAQGHQPPEPLSPSE